MICDHGEHAYYDGVCADCGKDFSVELESMAVELAAANRLNELAIVSNFRLHNLLQDAQRENEDLKGLLKLVQSELELAAEDLNYSSRSDPGKMTYEVASALRILRERET